jgi:hypothetical protein
MFGVAQLQHAYIDGVLSRKAIRPDLRWSLDGGAWQPITMEFHSEAEMGGSRLPYWQSGGLALPDLAAGAVFSLRFWVAFGAGTTPGSYDLYLSFHSSGCDMEVGRSGPILFAYDPGGGADAIDPPAPGAGGTSRPGRPAVTTAPPTTAPTSASSLPTTAPPLAASASEVPAGGLTPGSLALLGTAAIFGSGALLHVLRWLRLRRIT